MLAYHYGHPYQRGQGLGNLFSGFLKRLIPLSRTFFKSKPGKILKDVALNTASHFAQDVLSGKNVKSSAKENLSEAKTNLGQLLKQTLTESETPVPKKKQKRRIVRRVVSSKRRRNYNLLTDG